VARVVVAGGILSASLMAALALLERPADVGEGGFLPYLGRQVPVAGPGFVVVGIRSAPGDGGIAPIVHAELQEGSWPDADAGFGAAAFEFARGNCGAGPREARSADAVGALANIKNDDEARAIVG
jgi:hypothetical protein